MTKEVALIYRKQFPNTFSIEFIFDKLISSLQISQKIQKYTLPYYSNSFFNRLLNLICILFLPGKILHVSGDVHYAILGAWFKKRVLTIHDLAFMHQNKGAKRSILKWFYIILPVKFAHQITVISEATKADLLQYVSVDPQKIKVIPNFISEIYQPVKDKNFNTIQPQILQVGTAFNKNIERLVEAISNVNCKLIIIGSLNNTQLTTLQKFKINYINKLDLTGQELVSEYQKADLLAFTSTIEGFGMPILEAQACGLPVVTSNCSSMPEVAGDAAVFVDPFEIQSIKNGISEMISNAKLREELIKKGFENIKRFSKESIVAQYDSLYQELENS
ncbi:glycosyltransferase family 4 protein [Mucilaginibacter sp.]|uniref:glycosyltransferase family 4 protein n=1 Tax=Mucilaginibacter sp. TaxID=1882438 RepID=UPI003B00C4EC